MKHVAALDGIRGIAILMVLAHQLILDGVPQTLFWRLLLVPLQAGWVGVQLFFVLSGFLITRILGTTRGSENYWQSFYMRRALRIFPLYYLLLAVMFWGVTRLDVTPPGFVVPPEDRVWFWTYLSNWGTLFGAESGVLGHCWSLAVEEQFYLVWPFIVRWLDDRRLARLCGGLALGVFLLRVVALASGVAPDDIYTNTLTRLDALALGSLAAVVDIGETNVAWFERVKRQWPVLVLSVVVIGVLSGGFSRVNPVTLSVGHSVLALTFAMALCVLTEQERRGAQTRWARPLCNPLLGLFGKHSYAIYLIHLPIHVWFSWAWLEHLVGQAPPLGVAAIQVGYWLVGPLALLALARLIYAVVEGPILGLKRHFAVRV